jgi:beta-galactosidase
LKNIHIFIVQNTLYMKRIGFVSVIILLITLLLAPYNSAAPVQGREILNFNFDWKFYKGDIKDGQRPDLDVSGWRDLDLPHDWSIEGPFSKDNSSCTGYLPGGIGWYRKKFDVPANQKGGKVFISFDGIYNNSEVWINGKYLGKRPNGYISFQYDLTPFIIYGGENLIAVKVDHTKSGDSRWYTGSGIYRNVNLVFSSPVHIRQWGVYVAPKDVTASKAVLDIEVGVVNETTKTKDVRVTNYLMFKSDTVGEESETIRIDANSPAMVKQRMNIKDVALWDIEQPELYSLVTVVKGKGILDSQTTTIGFRDIKFDAAMGLFLNGRRMKLKGICMHHDAGALGSAVPREEISRRLDILKEMGCNAIRTSHNPFSPDFLELCDQKGFLVIDEAFDEWELPKKKWLQGWNAGTPGKDGYAVDFKEWGKTDLRDFILRDRNHPSVIMWSIGNEVDYPNDPYTHQILNTEANPQTWAKYNESLPDANRLGVVARELVTVIKELDKTRPVTAGLASALMSNETGYAAALDVAGYNYQEFRYESDHKKYPDRPLYGSENGMTLEMWNYVADNDYVMGQFLWTGFEYLGEAGRFPVRSNTAGVIDLAGNKKPEFYFRQSLWSDKPMVFLGTSDRLTERGPVSLWAHKRVEPVWNWENGKMISVNAFSNCEEVELFLNEKSLGSKKMEEFRNRTITWEVPFEKGTLKAVAKNKGREAASFELKTTGTPAMISAICDQTSLKPDRMGLAHIFVNLQDEAGNTVYTAENEITCEISGLARLLGMEDSNPSNIEDYKDNKQKAFHGKLLIYLQSADKTGPVTVNLSSPGLQGETIRLTVAE